jgi:hypothetical protein
LTEADDVLRRACREADDRAASLRVLAVDVAAQPDAEAALDDVVARWSEKYPQVAVAVARRPEYDAAIALSAATAGCVLAVVAAPPGPRGAAVVASAVRRSRCPVVVLPNCEEAP